jgi:hypothetical protein
LGLLLSCASTFDTVSGGDDQLMGARDLVLDVPSTDRVSNRTHDNTDWKTFEYLGYRGRVVLDVYWDNPSVRANLSLRNQFNQELLSVKHKKKVQHERHGPINVAAGKYYVRVQCNEGESTYTLQIRDAENNQNPGGSFDQLPE